MGKGAAGEFQAESFTVKNTFVELDWDYFEEEGGGLHEAAGSPSAWTRQTSEPALAISKDADSMHPFMSNCRSMVAQRERSLWSQSVDEPEQEIEPCQPQPFVSLLPFQETEFDCAAAIKMLSGLHVTPPPSGAGGHADRGSTSTSASSAGGGEEGARGARACWADMSAGAGTGDEGTTTVMMRNLPNKYSQQMLRSEIDANGFAETYDFLYLPMDMETRANKGYAFINFVQPCHVWDFKVAYEGKQMKRFNSSKFVSVNPAALQGFEANYAHYSMARCSRGDPEARPLFLRDPEKSSSTQSPGGKGANDKQRRRVKASSGFAGSSMSQQLSDDYERPQQPRQQLALAGQFPMSQWAGQPYDQQWQYVEWAMPNQQHIQMSGGFEAIPAPLAFVSEAGDCGGGNDCGVTDYFCRRCGHHAGTGHRFCGQCGAALPSS